MDVTRTVDNTEKFMKRLEALTSQEVLVGVPAEKTSRPGEQITNASIAYIHEFGSPAKNIPARSFMRPGVRNVREAIAAEMRKGAKDILAGGGNPMKTLQTVGMLARNSVVRAITDPAPPFIPLKYATIRARLRRTGGGRRKLQKFDKIKNAAGWTGAEAARAMKIWGTDEGNIRPLLDTLRLRNSITYVIRPSTSRFTFFGYQADYGKIILR